MQLLIEELFNYFWLVVFTHKMDDRQKLEKLFLEVNLQSITDFKEMKEILSDTDKYMQESSISIRKLETDIFKKTAALLDLRRKLISKAVKKVNKDQDFRQDQTSDQLRKYFLNRVLSFDMTESPHLEISDFEPVHQGEKRKMNGSQPDLSLLLILKDVNGDQLFYKVTFNQELTHIVFIEKANEPKESSEVDSERQDAISPAAKPFPKYQPPQYTTSPDASSKPPSSPSPSPTLSGGSQDFFKMLPESLTPNGPSRAFLSNESLKSSSFQHQSQSFSPNQPPPNMLPLQETLLLHRKLVAFTGGSGYFGSKTLIIDMLQKYLEFVKARYAPQTNSQQE